MDLHKTLIILVTVVQISNSNMLHILQNVTAAVDWNNFVILHDGDMDSSVKKLSYLKLVTIYSLDLKNANAIYEVFESVSKTLQINWLVLCSDCASLLAAINEFESSYEMHGYFTHRYQWIFITNFTKTMSEFENNVGNITNLAVLDVDKNFSVYTAMFGTNKRYFDVVTLGIKDRIDIFPNLQNGFNGARLKLCTVPLQPFIVKEINGTYTGYYIELLEIIASELNFTFTAYEPEDGQYGSVQNGQWTGMVRELIDKKADIACVLNYIAERLNVVDFPDTPVDVDYALIIYHKPEPLLMSVDILLVPFQQTVWICFTSIVVATTIAFFISFWLNKSPEDVWYTFEYAVYIFRATLNDGSRVQPRHQSGRVIYTGYYLGCIILMATYTGHLVAHLTIKRINVPFETIRGVAESTDYTFGVTGGSSDETRMMNGNFSPGSTMALLKEKVLRDVKLDPDVLSDDYYLQVNKVITSKHALQASRSMFDAIAEEHCTVSALKEKGILLKHGFMLQKNSIYTEKIDNILLKIKEGELDQLIKMDFWPKPKECDDKYTQVVNLDHIFGVFYILCAGLSIAFLTLLAEISFSYMCKSKQKTNSGDTNNQKCYI